MIKTILSILFSGILVACTLVYAEVSSDAAQHGDHGEHVMDNEDHSGHAMGHSDHDDHDDHAKDSGDHSDHGEHAMDHGDHDEHAMEHDDHGQDGDEHAVEHDDHSEHGEMLHGDDHPMHAPPSEHEKHMSSDDHTDHMGDHHHHADDGHIMDHEGGHIMGQNFDKLPSSCESISEDIEITVHGGREYAGKFPGTIFAFDQQEWRVKPCSRITWHFVNEDHIRHQFMIHGLPRYLYQNGMFHLESTGPRTITGTMIVPGADETYLAHCDMSQHMEKGMKAQLVVGNGGEDLPSIPGLTPYAFTDTYVAEDLPQVSVEDDEDSLGEQVTDFFTENSPISGMMFIGILAGVLAGMLSALLIAKFKLARKKNDDPQ